MSPLLALFGVTLVAALFFVVIPGVGATTVRRAWRQFRASIESASLLPTLRLGADAQETAASGSYRFFGSLEAIQGDDLMWLTDGRLTVGAHLGGVYRAPFRPLLTPHAVVGVVSPPGTTGQCF